MTVVAVTGAAGWLGELVIEALESREGVTRVVGIDTAAPAVATRNLEVYRIDVRNPMLDEVLSGCDAVVHLARAPASADPQERRDVDVRGARNVAASALRAGVRRVVYLSSALVYGAHPDNDVPLTEVSGVRPVPGLAESEHPALAEDLIAGVLADAPGTVLTTLRRAHTVGPRSRGLFAQLLAAPVLLRLRGYEPPVQVVHEDDLVRVIVSAATGDMPGVFNVCADGWLSPARVAALGGQRLVAVSEEAARRQLDLARRAGLSAFPAAALPLFKHPTVMSSLSLRERGLAPAHGNEAAILAAAAANRGWVTLGRVRFRPRIAAGLAGAAALVGTSVAMRGLRRRAPAD